MQIRGAVVAITGASAGIGWETALAFAGEGARIAICARRRDRLEKLAAEIAGRGGEVLVEAVDVAQRGEVFRFVEAVVARWGRLDVLVNNAGYGAYGRVEDTSAEMFEQQMRVNYLGTVYGCQAALPILRRQRSGLIVNVSSVVGHRAMPNGSAYAATKAAQISLTESLRVELLGSGVYASSVHPIGTETEFRDVVLRQSGQSYPGLGPQQKAVDVARAIVRCAKRPRPEVYPAPLSRGLVWLNAFWPALVDRLAAYGARKSGRL